MLTFGLEGFDGETPSPALAQRGGMRVIIYQGLGDRWFIPLLPLHGSHHRGFAANRHLLVLGVAERRFDA